MAGTGEHKLSATSICPTIMAPVGVSAPYAFGGVSGAIYNLTRGHDNSRIITRVSLEERVVAGLKNRPTAPDMVAEAARSCIEGTKRLNRLQRSDRQSAKAKLLKIKKGNADFVNPSTSGRDSPTDRLLAVETVLKA